jgi:hypothetical protein
MTMRYLFFVLFSVLASYVSAEGALDQSLCSKTEPENKFVFKLYKDHGIQVCSLAEFQESGEECEYGYGGTPSWSEILDLNGDGHFDLIVSYFSGGMWRGDKPFHVFLNCGNNTFVKVMEDNFTHVGSTKNAGKNGMIELTAIRAESIGEDKYSLQRYILKFNVKKSEYITAPVGRKFQMTEEAEKEWATKDAPKNFTNWDSFPAN